MHGTGHSREIDRFAGFMRGKALRSRLLMFSKSKMARYTTLSV
jgi:hypothetical protein